MVITANAIAPTVGTLATVIGAGLGYALRQAAGGGGDGSDALAMCGAAALYTCAALLALKNLLREGEHPALEFAVVEKGLPKVIATRMEQNWDDSDIPMLLEWMQAHLEAGALALTSLERYKKEVMSGALRRSPLHDSEAFWGENAERLVDSNCLLLKALLRLLEVSRDPVTLTVACKDLSQFVTYYPHGKGAVADLKGKQLAMRLLAHPDGEVQKEALVCVQRLLLSRDSVDYMDMAQA